MKPVDPELLERIRQQVALQVTSLFWPSAPPAAVEEYAVGLKLDGQFRAIVEATVDAYRYLVGEPPPWDTQATSKLVDLERMTIGVELLGALRMARLDQRPDVDLVWVMPLDCLAGVTSAYGLRIVRSPETSRPTLAIQWAPRAMTTVSDESEKGT